MAPTIIVANLGQAGIVSSVLAEAAEWVAGRSERLWHAQHVSVQAVAPDVELDTYFIAWLNGDAAGVVRLQMEDPEFWPDAAEAEAIYVHRLAVRRKYAGGEVSGALLEYAARRAGELGRKYLRLDCAADRPALRNVYKRFGFRFCDEREMGSFVIARYELAVAPAA